MPYKDPIKQKEAQAKHFQNNKERYNESNRRSKMKRLQWMREYKASKGCSRCGDMREPVLEFHHPNARNGEEHTISYLVRRVGMEKLKKSIEECEVLCSNCHKLEHWNGSDFLPQPNDGTTDKGRRKKRISTGKVLH